MKATMLSSRKLSEDIKGFGNILHAYGDIDKLNAEGWYTARQIIDTLGINVSVKSFISQLNRRVDMGEVESKTVIIPSLGLRRVFRLKEPRSTRNINTNKERRKT